MFLPVLIYSQDIVWSEESSFLELGDKLELLEDETGTLTFEQVSSPAYNNKFQKSDNVNLSLGYTESFFWLRFTIDNKSKNDLTLEIAQAGLPIADLYYQRENMPVKYVAAGYQIPFNEKLIKNSFQVFPISSGKTTCYIQLNTNSEPIPIHLFDKQTFETKSTNQKFSYGIYLGLMFFVVLNNFFFFISFKKYIYLFYTFIVLLYISYSAAVIDGFIVYFMPQVDLIFLYTTIPALGIIIQTIYCLLFLETKKYIPKIHKIIIGVIIYFGAWFLAKFFFSFPIVQPINTVNALISFFVMAYVGIKVGANGNRLGYYFAIAYFIYFILVAMQALYINTGAPDYIGGLSHVAYATLIESLILSFLLSKRSEWEKNEIEKDKMEAQEQVLETIRENEQIVQEQNILLEEQVTIRTAQLQEINAELITTNDKLVEMDQYKESMTAMIVHDFKNSLNTVISFSESTPSQRRLKSIRHAGQFMLNLVLNMLDVQKFENTKVDLALANYPISKVIHEAIDQLNYLIEQKAIKLTINQNKEFYSRFDYDLVTRVFLNILSNAIKYVDNKGVIEITAEKKGDFVHVSLKDNGAGIPDDKIHLVFDKFSQIKARKSESIRSTGIGLTFCKIVVEAHGGEIDVESQEGQGSNFYFTLPFIEHLEDSTNLSKDVSAQLKRDKSIVFSEKEKELLVPFLEKLQKWEIYDYSEIIAISKEIPTEYANINTWKEQIMNALHSVNEDEYLKLINI